MADQNPNPNVQMWHEVLLGFGFWDLVIGNFGLLSREKQLKYPRNKLT
jgi:hypothetical protein